jgi:hypothetical protein
MTRERISEWWRLWREEVAIGTIATTVICLIIGVCWYLFQTIPADLTEGEVVDRSFVPAHWEDYMRPVTRTRQATRQVCSGGYGSVPQTCRTEFYTETYTDYVPDERWVEDDWNLEIDGCSENRRGDNICRTDWVDVSESVYDDCDLGAYWREETACRLL